MAISAELRKKVIERAVTLFMLRINDKDRMEQRHDLMKVNRYPCKKQE